MFARGATADRGGSWRRLREARALSPAETRGARTILRCPGEAVAAIRGNVLQPRTIHRHPGDLLRRKADPLRPRLGQRARARQCDHHPYVRAEVVEHGGLRVVWPIHAARQLAEAEEQRKIAVVGAPVCDRICEAFAQRVRIEAHRRVIAPEPDREGREHVVLEGRTVDRANVHELAPVHLRIQVPAIQVPEQGALPAPAGPYKTHTAELPASYQRATAPRTARWLSPQYRCFSGISARRISSVLSILVVSCRRRSDRACLWLRPPRGRSPGHGSSGRTWGMDRRVGRLFPGKSQAKCRRCRTSPSAGS